MRTLLTICLFLTCTFVQAQEKPKAPIVLIGGGTIPKDAVEWLKNKSEKDKYAVITCNLESSEKKWSPHFPNLLFTLPENANDINIDEIAGIILEGGDQWNYITKLDSKFVERVYASGKSIMATSAGAQILGQSCFTAEEGTVSSEEAVADSPKIHLKNFLNIDVFVDTFVDTHFSERDRLNRLKVFMKKSGLKKGYGIDEATALCIYEKLEVKGIGSVTVLKDETTEILSAIPQEIAVVTPNEIRSNSAEAK